MNGHRQIYRNDFLRQPLTANRYRLSPHCGGFTLIELMVAIILFALVSTAVYGSYSTVMRTTDGLYDHLDELERVRTCIAHIQADLASVQVVPADLYKPPDQRPTPDAYQILADDDPVTGDFRFSFVSLNHLPISGSTYPRPMKIVYFAERNNDDTWTLFRNQYPLDSEPPADQPVPKLATGLATIAWEFIGHDGRATEKWNSESDDFGYGTPRAIKVKLNFKTGTDQSHSGSEDYETLVALPVARKGES